MIFLIKNILKNNKNFKNKKFMNFYLNSKEYI